MFLEEARLASRIQHPNVISTVDVATTEGEVFIVMEYVAGESLAKLVRSALKKGERIPVEVAATVLAGMLHGLHATHEAKNEQLEPMHIVHRDVSPQNVLVGVDGIARIFDFGVAKAAAMRSQATTDGQMKGKLSYMSPEQLNSREVDRRTDIFAAGVVAWECLTGRRLFAGSDPGEVLAKVLTLDIPAPVDVLSSIPTAVSNTVMQALARSPDQRWQTARDFAIELERTVVLAAAHVVGNWVEQNASEALQDRRHRVQMVERASVDLGHVGMHAAMALPDNVPAPNSHRLDQRSSDPPDLVNAGSGTHRASNLTVSSTATATPHSFARQVGLTVLLGVLGAAAVAGAWYWQQHNLADPDSNVSPAALPDPPTEVAASPEKAGRAAAPEEKDGVVPPVLQIDSLPEHNPDASMGSRAAAALSLRAGPPAPRFRRGRRGAPGPVHNPPRVEAPTPPNKPEPATAAAPATAAPEAKPLVPLPPKSECEPPWYIDAKGIQRLKPKCL
jgi:serine/threonine-protein kinase